jgi:ABC-type polysaccharide/polyol phosphate transport system ATPase subunit
MDSIEVDNVSKVFRLYKDRPGSVKEMFTKFGKKRYEDFWAVRDVTVNVGQGTVHGLIGHNGCGKSTLLRMMAGIHTPTSGRVTTRGRVSALLELGAGFHPELTGRENVYLNAAILGLSRKQTDALFDRIVDFSGLAAFIDSPVKHYSSGMFVRLGFSVAVHVEPQILLVDEVIAVGDEEFQRRCLDHLASLKKSGVTIVVVSHSMGVMQNLCDHVTWIDHGRVRSAGDPMTVIGDYLHEVNAEEEQRVLEGDLLPGERPADATVFQHAQLVNEEGLPLSFARTGEPVSIRAFWDSDVLRVRPAFVLSIENESGILLGSTRVSAKAISSSEGVAERMIDCCLNPFLLSSGRYVATISAVDPDTHLPLPRVWKLTFHVRDEGQVVQGLVEIPAIWSGTEAD